MNDIEPFDLSDKDKKSEDFCQGWDVGIDALEALSELVANEDAQYESMLLMGALAVFLNCIYKSIEADDADQMIRNAMEFSRTADHEPDGTVH